MTNPLALLLAEAAALAGASGSPTLAAAIIAVIALNAVFSFFQEVHAEHAVAALAAYLPSGASVQRDGARREDLSLARPPAYTPTFGGMA